MAYCPKCGRELADTARFCGTCGTLMSEKPAVATPPSAASSGSSAGGTASYSPAYRAPAPSASGSPVHYPTGEVYSAPAPVRSTPAPAYGTPAPAYGAPAAGSGHPPANVMRTNRALWRVVVFGLLTLGIYDTVCMSNIVDDTNIICSRYDGRRTMNFFIATGLLGPITLFIYTLIWGSKLYSRIGEAQVARRTTATPLTAGAFWIGLIPIVGPFISMHKLCVAINQICAHYNVNG